MPCHYISNYSVSTLTIQIIKYRIGQCYINIPGEKIKAIKYLEEAVKNINPDYKEGKFTETKAPYDALYYLANAYRINNQLDKAIKTYELFRKNLNPDIYDSTIVDLQIQSCRNAGELMRMPLFIKQKNLGPAINGSNNEYNPVVSEKEDMLVFSRSQAFYDALLYSTKKNGKWTEPMNMNEMLKVDRDLFPTSLSKDGTELYLYSSADYDGIIYSSRFEKGVWAPVVKLNDNINTKYWESHATISHDNKKLFFTSNRKGTLGGLDIYVSKRDSSGNWGSAVNLGPIINTPYNEESPFLSNDDKTLFFSSRGHFNMGGYDIFYSTLLDNGEWSAPINVGYPLNTTDDDVFFIPLNKGFEGYTSKEIKGGLGKQDIYRIEVFSDNHPRKFYVRGTVKVADLINSNSDSIKITAMNLKNPDQVSVAYSDPQSGQYKFQLPQGDFQFAYEGQGGERTTKKVELLLLNPSDSILLPATTIPKTDLVADLNVGTNAFISVMNGDSLLFPLTVEPNSVLTIENWAGEKLISTETFRTTGSSMNYRMAPKVGDNKVAFKLTDRYNNTTKTEVIVSREKKVASQQVQQPRYDRTISENQIASYAEMLKAQADGDLLKIIAAVSITERQFEKADDYLSAVKTEAAKNGIESDEVDKLALKVAVTNNILSQAAVDYLAKHSTGDLKKILDDLNIYDANLKSWTDLQQYILAQSDGKITAEDLNRIAEGMLTGTVAPEVPKDEIPAQDLTSAGNGYLWILWAALGLGLFFLFFILWRRKKDKKKEE